MNIRILFLLLCVISFGELQAQVRFSNSLSHYTAANSSAFIDASSNMTYNNSTNVGKGLLFPRADLTAFSAISPTMGGLTTNYPTRFDGMIVYNTATGTAALGGGEVTPGFYYYSNPGAHNIGEGNSNQGTWVRLTDGNDSSAGSSAADAYYGVLTTTSPAEGDITGLTTVSLASGSYEPVAIASTASEGYFTIAIPVSWRNPLLTIEGNDTWNIILPITKLTINDIEYQVWQTDVQIPSGKAIAIL